MDHEQETEARHPEPEPAQKPEQIAQEQTAAEPCKAPPPPPLPGLPADKTTFWLLFVPTVLTAAVSLGRCVAQVDTILHFYLHMPLFLNVRTVVVLGVLYPPCLLAWSVLFFILALVRVGPRLALYWSPFVLKSLMSSVWLSIGYLGQNEWFKSTWLYHFGVNNLDYYWCWMAMYCLGVLGAATVYFRTRKKTDLRNTFLLLVLSCALPAISESVLLLCCRHYVSSPIDLVPLIGELSIFFGYAMSLLFFVYLAVWSRNNSIESMKWLIR